MVTVLLNSCNVHISEILDRVVSECNRMGTEDILTGLSLVQLYGKYSCLYESSELVLKINLLYRNRSALVCELLSNKSVCRSVVSR